MNATVTTRVTLPAGTKMKWLDRPDGLDAEPQPVLVRDDGSAVPYLCAVQRTGGEVGNYWFNDTAVEEDLDAFPEPDDPRLGLPEDHRQEAIDGIMECLRYWCEESDVPVLDSVDEQATWLHNVTSTTLPGKPNLYVCWPRTGTWHSSGPGKDYLGKVMRRARKVRSEREAGQTLTATESATPESDVVSDLRSQVAAREAEVENLTHRLGLARRHHQEDITLIGEKLMYEAEQRDWCSEYDDVVEGLNNSLHIELPTRSRDVDVNYSVTLTVTLNRSTTVSVSGGDDPRDVANDQFDSYEVEDEVRRALENAYLSVDSVSVASTDDYEEES